MKRADSNGAVPRRQWCLQVPFCICLTLCLVSAKLCWIYRIRFSSRCWNAIPPIATIHLTIWWKGILFQPSPAKGLSHQQVKICIHHSQQFHVLENPIHQVAIEVPTRKLCVLDLGLEGRVLPKHVFPPWSTEHFAQQL